LKNGIITQVQGKKFFFFLNVLIKEPRAKDENRNNILIFAKILKTMIFISFHLWVLIGMLLFYLALFRAHT